MAVKQLVFEIIGKDASGSAAIKKVQQSATEVGAVFLTTGAAITAGLGLSIKKFADFDQAMSNVKAATHETTDNMELLRAAALKAGADTVYSATEAASAQEELSKASVSTSDILSGGLSGALSLAAAGQTSVGNAAEYAATAMTQFGLKGKDVPHIADLLAAGAGKAQGSVDDLSQALAQGGLVASRSSHTLEETVGTLAAFANAGLKGSDAGTSLKTAIIALQKPSSAAQGVMDDYGISVYDSAGKMLSFSGIAGVLEDRLGDLTEQSRNAALATIFGTDAVRAGQIWYEQGAKGIEKWNKAVDDQGYAAQTASDRLDNLNGDIEKLSGSFETALIKNGEAANGVLRFLTQTAGEAIDKYSELPGPLQATGTTIAAVGGAATLAAGAFLVGAPKVTAYRDAVDRLGPVAQRTGRILGTFAKGTAILAGFEVATTLLDGWQASADRAAGTADKLNNLISTGADPVENLSAAFSENTVLGYGYADSLDLVTGSFSKFIDQVDAAPDMRWASFLSFAPDEDRARDQFVEMGKALADVANRDAPAAAAQIERLRSQYNLTDDQLTKLINLMPEYKSALTTQATALNLTADDATLLALAQGTISTTGTDAAQKIEGVTDAALGAQDASESAAKKVSELAESIRNFGKDQLDSNAAQRSYEQAVDDATEKLEEQKRAYEEANGSLDGFTASLDIGSQEGRDNSAALDEIASSANAAAAAIFAQTGQVDQSTGALTRGRDALIAQLAQFGITGAAADEYVAKLLATPEDITTMVRADTTPAENTIEGIKQYWENRGINIPAYVIQQDAAMAARAPGSANGNLFAAGVPQTFANGGFPTGIYNGRPGALYKFAEPETKWEAFISGRPGQEERNRAIAIDALRRLGGPNVMSVSGATTGALAPAQYGADALAEIAYGGDYEAPSSSTAPAFAAARGDGAGGQVNVYITNRTDLPIKDLISVEVEQSGRRRKVSLENGSRR